MQIQTEGEEPSRLRVLEIVGNAIVGGMEHYVLNLISRLSCERYQVTCLSPFESPFTRSLREYGCQVIITPIADDPPWRSIQLAVELIGRERINLIHAHMPKAHALAGLAACVTHVPAVATVHGMQVTTQEAGICRTTGTHLITVCQDAYSEAIALGLPRERIHLVPNGVDLNRFQAQCAQSTLRASLGIASDVPLVGFVGRLDHDKGPDIFLQVAEAVHRRCEHAQFVLVGTGELERQLAEQIHQKGCEHIHLAGIWPNVWEVYPALDLMVSTSRREGMPLALLEAMACGVPIVAMAVGGVPEVIEYGTTGYVTPAGDVVTQASMVARLLAEPEQRQCMGLAARQRAEELFDLQETVRRTTAVFEQIVKGTRSMTTLPEKARPVKTLRLNGS